MARRSRKSGFDIFIKLIISMFKAIEKDNKRKAKEQQKASKEAQKKAEKTPQVLFKKYRSEILSKAPITTQQAIGIYRRFYKELDDYDSQFEFDLSIEDLKEVIQAVLLENKEEYEDYKSDIRYDISVLRDDVKELKNDLKSCEPEEREDLIDEIETLEDEINEEKERLKLPSPECQEHQKFKKDKSEFLIEHIRVDVYGCE